MFFYFCTYRTVDGWRDAVLLKQGDTLILAGSDGNPTTIQVDGIRYETKVLTTYNLEVANAHTFFVGEDGVLVHKYLRQASNFNKRGAIHTYRASDNTDIWRRKSGEFLQERNGKIVTYGKK